MAFYPPPDEVLPIFNPTNFQTQANTDANDIPFLTQYFLRFPTSQGSEVVAGSLTSQQQLTANTNIVLDGTANTNYIEFPDGTKQFTAGTSGGGGSSLLNGDNDWTGTNTFSANTSLTGGATTITIANDASSTTDIATTAFVQSAIQNALNPIVPPPNPTSISYTFDGSVFSDTFVVPANALSYNISLGSCGGYCGANAYDPPLSPTINQFAMYAGGQGGGGQQGSNTWNELSPDYQAPLLPAEMAGQTITIFNTGHGVGTSCGFSYTQSGTGLPITCSFNNGGDGGDASVGTAGTAGTGAVWSSPPSFNASWTPNATASAGATGDENLAVNATSVASSGVPYAPLNPPYTGPQAGVFYGNPSSSQFLPFITETGTASGANGMGQIYSAVGSPSTLVCEGVSGYNASPVGKGYLTIQFFYASQGAIGGTNASFIAYDDPDPATKTKQIYTDKEGLVVSQDLTGSYKTTTLTPTNLTQDLNGVVSTALIADIILVANAGPTTPDLDAVLTAGNTSTTAILIQDATTPATLFSQMSDTGFIATDATGSPQYDASVSANNISVSTTNGDSNTLTAGSITLANATPNSNILNLGGMTTTDSLSLVGGTSTTLTANDSLTLYSYTNNINITAFNDGVELGEVFINKDTPDIGDGILNVGTINATSPYNFSVVSIYADATARDTGIPSPYAGQIAFLTGSNKLQYWNTNWYNVNVVLNTPIITGFTLSTNYDIIYVNASNSVINAPTLGGYTIVRFNPTTTTSGTITLSNTTSVEYLVVAGGGGGAGGAFTTYNGGGGGAGGLLTATDTMVEQVSYAVSVGGGGAAGVASGNGGNGTNSSLVVSSGTITATGGGGGGAGVAGLSGGSGGGAGWTGVVLAGGAGTALQGNTGGSSTTSSPYSYSGGGGGSSAVGSSSNGQGGAGISSAITGATLFYAGGGGGGASTGIDIGANPLPTGGSGVGGNGGYKSGPAVAPTAGTNGRGGGGGGRGNWTSSAGASGGSGKVVVRFPSYT